MPCRFLHIDRVIAVFFAGVLAGCGKNERPAMEATAPKESKPAAKSEMLPLSPKRVSRKKDRGITGQTSEATVIREAVSDVRDQENWESEELSAQVVEHLRAFLTTGVPPQFADHYHGTALVPSQTQAVFDDDDLTVIRGMEGVVAMQKDLVEAAAELKNRFFHANEVNIHLKPVGVNMVGNEMAVAILVEVWGRAAEASSLRQINAKWTTQWQLAERDLRLRSVKLENYEEGTLNRPTPLFQDVTASVLGETPAYELQVLRGIEYWNERITRYGDMYLTGHHGLAVGDVDGDGREDLYVCDGGSLPNRLYLQKADGTVREAAAEANVDFLEDSRGALLVDLDNDGDQDLVVATVAIVIVAENDGAGNFTLRGGHTGAPYPASISAADVDDDRDLDLYVCVYEAGDAATGSRWFEARSPVPFQDANNGGRNVLLENLGDFDFADATAKMGLEENNQRWSFAAAWEDWDQDGDMDLAVANDFGRNNLYQNDGSGGFIDIAAKMGVEDTAAGMSVSWGDANRDGRMDLYFGNMYSSAGKRVSYQRRFLQEHPQLAAPGLQRMARGNSLFLGSLDSDPFVDVSEAAGVTMGRWAWSSGFVDFNNDGWEDLAVANGYLTNTRSDDL